jgi:ferredoxin
MGEIHTVRLEPVGIEFEVEEDETVMNGAFRQGLMLMHGCKEGQCAACKSFLIDAAIELLVRRDVPEGRIYYDKFTTTADAEESRT